MNEVIISVTKLKQGDIYTWLQYAWNADKIEFISTFKKLNINIDNEKDLDYLREIYSTCGDKKGMITTDNGTPITFDLLQTLQSIEISSADLVNSKVKFSI